MELSRDSFVPIPLSMLGCLLAGLRRSFVARFTQVSVILETAKRFVRSLGLALRRGGMLATWDERIAALTEPKSTERNALEIAA